MGDGAKAAASDPAPPAQEIDPNELKRRTEFLKAQRDKVSDY